MNVPISNKRKAIIDTASKRAKKRKWPCFYPRCSEKAIKSHSQSVSSSLRSIAQDGFVIEKNFRAFPETPSPEWKKIGVNKATVFPGFCSKHDAKLFRQADAINDKNLHDNALWSLSFRTFAMEMRKKEYYAHFTDKILKQDNEILYDPGAEYLNAFNTGLRNCLRVTQPYYLRQFELFFTSEKKPPMDHRIFKYERNLGVSCSTFINPVPMLEQPLDRPQPMIAFNILPRKAYTLVILSSFVKDSKKMDNFIHENRRLEDLVFNYSEEVILSIELFSSFSRDFLQIVDEAQRPWNTWKEETIPDIFFVSLDTEFLLLTSRSPGS